MSGRDPRAVLNLVGSNLFDLRTPMIGKPLFKVCGRMNLLSSVAFS